MLYVGDDWAEDHHDVEIQDETGRRLGKARLPEGIAGVARLHELIAEHLPAGTDADASPGPGVGSEVGIGSDQVLIGIETDRGPWVLALVAAGYQVYPINPRQVARFRERHSNAGAKSDARDAHTLADMVRTDGHQLRPIAGDTPAAAGVKILARAHQTLIWERIRHQLRLRSGLREYFPAALVAFDDLAARDALELLGKAPDPTTAARLTRAQIGAALRRARRRDVDAKAAAIAAALRTAALTQPDAVVAAFAAITRSLTAVISAVSVEIDRLAKEMAAAFDRHPDALISPAWPPCWGRGRSASSATTPAATPTPEPGRTSRGPRRSPGSRGRRRPCTPDTCTTPGSSTPSAARPKARCPARRVPGLTRALILPPST